MKLGQRLRQAKWRKWSLALWAALFLICSWLSPLIPGNLWLIVSDLFLFLLMASAFWSGCDFLGKEKHRPLTIVLYAVLAHAAILLVLLAIRGGALSLTAAKAAVSSRVALLALGMLLAAGLAASRVLFFLKREHTPRSYFNAMLLCFSLTYFIAPLAAGPFLISLSICLAAMNSFRVKWIAFLTKRQKIYLICMAASSLGISIANAVIFFGNETLSRILPLLAPGLGQAGKVISIYGACYSGIILFATLFHLPTADAFDRKADEAASLMDIGQSLTGTIDFSELAEKVTSVTARVCQADFAWLLIRLNGDFTTPAAYNIGTSEAREIGQAILADTAVANDVLTLLHDRSWKVHLQTDTLTFSFSSLAIAPLRVRNRVTGYLFMAIKKEKRFDDEDIRSAEAFANSAAIALENARMIEARLERERLKKELDVARDVQFRLLPSQLPTLGFADIAAYFSPAFEAGGDYYDFFPAGGDKIGFAIADVSGKGIAAAFVMAELKGICESLVGMFSSPKALLAKANDILKKTLEKNRFVSATFGLLDPQARVMKVARAGHMPFLVCSAGRVEHYTPAGLVLGLAQDPVFTEKMEEMDIPWREGDALVFITDGVTEAKNLLGNDFGLDRLKTIVMENSNRNADQLCAAIIAELKAFTNNPVQHDDITLLVFKMK